MTACPSTIVFHGGAYRTFFFTFPQSRMLVTQLAVSMSAKLNRCTIVAKIVALHFSETLFYGQNRLEKKHDKFSVPKIF